VAPAKSIHELNVKKYVRNLSKLLLVVFICKTRRIKLHEQLKNSLCHRYNILFKNDVQVFFCDEAWFHLFYNSQNYRTGQKRISTMFLISFWKPNLTTFCAFRLFPHFICFPSRPIFSSRTFPQNKHKQLRFSSRPPMHANSGVSA
jgi:hypothetical protein